MQLSIALRDVKRLAVFRFHAAFGTDAFQHIVDTVQVETVREFYHRHMDIGETECAMTFGAVEMRVFVLDNIFTFAVLRTNVILYRAAAVVNGMYQSVGKE